MINPTSNYVVEEGLPDIQKTQDERGLEIDQVGICELHYPIWVKDRQSEVQQTSATLSMSVGLPHDFKGTHMSRFIQVLTEHEGEFTMNTLPEILHELKERLDAATAHLEVSFPYYLTKTSPVSGLEAKTRYECAFIGESNGKKDDFLLKMEIPVATLCPCSKEISDYGAHNQRGNVTVTVRTNRKGEEWDFLWIEELVDITEQSASAPLYPLLKREDERYVTMQAYDNPVFVEDLVRNVALKLKAEKRVAWFEVKAVNQESIHNHNAFAVIRSNGETTS
jgi:GTP cyclohydrolase I